MTKQEQCPFKYKHIRYVDNDLGMRNFDDSMYQFSESYDACDIRNNKECVGEKICPIINPFKKALTENETRNIYKPNISEKKLCKLKEDIIKALNKTDGLYVSDLSEKLKIEPRMVIYAIRQLKDEGLLI